MDIEKSIELLKEFKKTGFHTLMIKYNEDRIHTNKLIEEAIETLLTAYEKEKEKNKELKWKPIKEYDRKKYDWVLVKYFDGDYECVPEVAEKRNDGKWYTSERQIPFEVKYFFDMQQILKEE